MKRRATILRAHDSYLASDKLDKREKWYLAGFIGNMAMAVVLEAAATDVRVAGVRDALVVGCDVAVGGGISFAVLSLYNSTKQSLAKDYQRLANTEFQRITDALAAEPDTPENQQLREVDRNYTELSGLPPSPTEDLE